MTVQNHNQEVTNERPYPTVQNPVAGAAKDRRLFTVYLSEDGGTVTNDSPLVQASGLARFEWDGPYPGMYGRFILVNVWADSREDARAQALQIDHDLF